MRVDFNNANLPTLTILFEMFNVNLTTFSLFINPTMFVSSLTGGPLIKKVTPQPIGDKIEMKWQSLNSATRALTA